MTDQIVMTVGDDIENLTDPARRNRYHGPLVKYHYGREVPKRLYLLYKENHGGSYSAL